MESSQKKLKKTKMLIRSSNSMPHFELLKKSVPYEKFTKYIKEKMSNYNEDILSSTNYGRIQSILYRTHFKFKKHEKEEFEKLRTRNLFYVNSRRNIQDKDDKKMTKVSVPKNNSIYENPLQSFSILKTNSKIQHEIIKSNLNRQKSLYNYSIDKIKLKNLKDELMPSIKITTIFKKNPKEEELLFMNAKKKKKNNNDEDDKISGPKKIKSFKILPLNSNPYTKLLCSYKYSNKNFPESREQFSLLINENTLYLIGGLRCIYSQEELWTCDIPTFTWTKIKSNTGAFFRFGHTAIFDKTFSKIFIYGGQTKYEQFALLNKNENLYRYCGLEYYDINQNEWDRPIISISNQPPLRKNHIAELIGSELVIMGGINESNQIFNDVYSLNLNFPNGTKEKWKKVDISQILEGPYVFGHSSSLAVQNAIAKSNKVSLYKYPDQERKYKLGVFIDKIKIKGLYIFGGKTKSLGTSGLSNDLYVLIIGKKPCVWKKFDKVIGDKPTPRYFHSMNYYEPGNFLIIHGGRNDTFSDSFALNDTYIFDLEFLEWHRVVLYSNIEGFMVMPRCAHRSVIHGNKLIIFGGMNNQSYIGSCLFMINLNPEIFEKNRLFVNSEDESS